MPGISGFIDGAWATYHVRSSRYRAVGPGRIGPECRSHGRGYRHRAAGGATRVASSCSGRRNAGRHASSLRSMNPASWPASFCSAHWPRAVGRRTFRTRCGQANMTPGASNSSPNGVAQPGSKPSRRAFLAIPRRGPGGPGCCARPPAPAAFRPCLRRFATPMCDICCRGFPCPRWCCTAGATARCMSRPAAIWPAGSRALNSSNSTATITGSCG